MLCLLSYADTVIASAVREGIELFISQFGTINVNGSTWDVEVIIYNDAGDIHTSAILYDYLQEKDRVHMLISPFSGSVQLGSLLVNTSLILSRPVINIGDVLFPYTSSSQRDWVFTTQPSFALAPDKCLTLLRQRGVTGIHVTGTQNGFAPFIEMAADRFNISTTLVEDTKVFFNAVVDELIAGDTKVIFSAASYGKNIGMLREYMDRSQAKLLLAILLIEGANYPPFLSEAGWLATDTLTLEFWYPGIGALQAERYIDEFFPSTVHSDSSTVFGQMFLERYNHTALYIHALAAHAIELSVLAFKKSGSLDPYELRTALKEMNTTTFLGPTSFDTAFQSLTSIEYYCVQYQRSIGEGGSLKVVSAEEMHWPASSLSSKPACWPDGCDKRSKTALALGLGLGLGVGLLLLAV